MLAIPDCVSCFFSFWPPVLFSVRVFFFLTAPSPVALRGLLLQTSLGSGLFCHCLSVAVWSCGCGCAGLISIDDKPAFFSDWLSSWPCHQPDGKELGWGSLTDATIAISL